MTFEDKIERGSFTGATATDVVEVSLPSMSSAMVQLTGTFSATTIFEVLVDEGSSPTWKAISATNVTTGAAATTATTAGIYSVSPAGARRFRARCSAFVSGPVVVAVNVSRGSAAGAASSGGGGGGGAVTVADGADVAEGTTTDAGIITDIAGTVIGFLRGAIIQWAKLLTQTGIVTEAAPATDTASSGLNGRLQRIAQRITSLIALVPAALVSGRFDVNIGAAPATVTVQGAKTNNNAAPGATNSGTLPCLANAATPTWTEGNQVANSVNLRGESRSVAGGYTTVLTTTLTRPADTTAYTAGDEMTDTGGAIQTITGAARFSGGSGIIQGVYVSQSTLWTTKPAMEIWVYDTTSTPVADNGAFAPTDGVTDTCIAVIPVTATYAGTVNQALDSGQISVPFVTSGSANLFFRIVIRNAAQDSANSGVTKFRWRILQD